MTLTEIVTAYLLLLGVAVVVVMVTTLAKRHSLAYGSRLEASLVQQYMRIISAITLSNEGLPSKFPMLEHRCGREILARVLATAATSLYGADVTIIGRIATDNGIDKWLLRCIRHSRGFKRAYYISLLAMLPLTSEMARQINKYSNDTNRYVRFYTLLIRIINDSSSALRELAEYKEALNSFELGEIMVLLRRGLLPVACEPLLASASRNLRAVGINIAREFGIEETSPLLFDIAATDTDEEVSQAALYALVSMHSSLSNSCIVASVRNMSMPARHSLCRCLVREGYSVSVLEELFDHSDGQYAEHLVATYKRRIICIPQL